MKSNNILKVSDIKKPAIKAGSSYLKLDIKAANYFTSMLWFNLLNPVKASHTFSLAKRIL